MMKYIIIPIATVFLATLLAACAGDWQPASTDTAASQTIQPGYEYLVYGVKTVVYSMSDYDANQQNIPLYQYVDQHTDIFSYSLEQQATKLIFSDKSLPVFIVNTSGGGETAIHDIVAVDPGSGMMVARMMPREKYTAYEDAGALYELSTDGTNQYKKLFDFNSPDSFALSPDATKIASIINDALVVRALASGDEISRIGLGEFKDNWISKISWAPDGDGLLMNVTAGEASVTPVEPYSQTSGCYLVKLSDRTMKKISGTVFQTPMELMPGFMTDPSSYAYFPRSNRLMGMARKYNARSYAVELFSVDLEGSNLVEIPIGNNESVWEFKVSPDEGYVAYQCGRNVCMSHLRTAGSEVVSQSPGANQEQTVIGWLEK
jgi:hypothetical protein